MNPERRSHPQEARPDDSKFHQRRSPFSSYAWAAEHGAIIIPTTTGPVALWQLGRGVNKVIITSRYNTSD